MPPTAPRSRAAAAARASAESSKKQAEASGSVIAPRAPGGVSTLSKPGASGRTASTTRRSMGGTLPTSPARPSQTAASPAAAFPPALPVEQRPLYNALRDEMSTVTSHPLLPNATIATAKTVFEAYVVEQWAAGVGLSSTALAAEYMEQVFADLGVAVTPNDARDLLFELNQGADVAYHNAKVAAQAAITATGAGADAAGVMEMTVTPPPPPVIEEASPAGPSQEPSGPPSPGNKGSTKTTGRLGATVTGSNSNAAKSSAPSATTAAATAALKSAGDAALVVSFGLFLDLLASTLGDCAYREEMGALWHALDDDGDEILSAGDLRRAFGRLALTADDTGAPPAHLAALQLSEQRMLELLAELDVDDDGVVSKKDFLSATNAN
uniref:EF-hand domain-containing protein n=1 Tax=Neobodo designis TaxID=312471 RepID=A0A7S1W7F4_NEODS|mmetsp:Transcript_5817/g.18327  ORF Transcript_5817/g.18327 Transcript_5817/m.18327 type:complete len:382 (+) Transcript_5817:122-1267(+)|eukprot:CAMPEP_0174842526 /NCGR_PEP_ID=MMETSP1114-20130205/9966_1 /TAXON_ID=312471 /ORGANISM="Neobodo designis, Strain CCAP 1951/1" /LENGTH=381 /DNA_ID=CAMNT_0016076731 /DNA_START=119 /DNA_END=1264 /DNA_ORIENTATION=+